MNKTLASSLATALVSCGFTIHSGQAYGSYSYRTASRQNTYSLPQLSKLTPPKESDWFAKDTVTPGNLSRLSPRAMTQSPPVADGLEIHHQTVRPQPKTASRVTTELIIAAQQPIRELVLIDAGVEDKHLYYAQRRPGVDYVELSANTGGLEQIQEILGSYQGLEALHLVSHAADGTLYLGNSVVTTETLRERVDVLASMDNALKDGADLLLYGCNLAETQAGEGLLELIKDHANVDIAASSNLTGASHLGGDWTLEVVKGELDSITPFSARAMRQYRYTLAPEVYTAGSFCTSNCFIGVPSHTSSDGHFVFTGNASGTSEDVYAYDSLRSNDGMYFSFQTSVDGDTTGFLNFAADGSNIASFELTALVYSTYGGSCSGGSVVGYVAGGGTVSNSLTWSGTNNSATLTNFAGVQITHFRVNGSGCSTSVYEGMGVRSFTVDNKQTTADSDGNLTASGAVTEPINLDTTVDTVGEAVDVFDFTLSDGGTSDGLPLTVSQVVVNVSGTTTDTERDKVTWRLNGIDASNVTGTYNAGSNTITFSGLSISIADGGSETYTVNAFYNDNTGLTEDATFILSVDGDTDLTVGGAGTQMGSTTAVTNGSGGTLDVTATGLAFTTQPAGSVSGSALSTQPVVTAQDAFGNTDVDFSETITVTEASAGSLTSNTATATAGVASFSGLTYTATADQQSFTLTANDQDGVGSNLPTADANAVTSNVVATQLAFSQQPAPLSVNSGQATSFTTVPVVAAVDGNGTVDTDYAGNFTLAEANGGGTATFTLPGDVDGGNPNTAALAPSSGAATFTGLGITYTNSGGANETFNLRANASGLLATDSAQLTSVAPPSISSATYDASTGVLTVSGANFQANGGPANDVDVSLLTLSGEQTFTYTLTSPDVEITSATEFSVALNNNDILRVNGILNRNGTVSDDASTYNLAAADDFITAVTAGDTSDSFNGVTVSNVAAPTITSATYNGATGVFSVSGTRFVAQPGAVNDVDLSLFTFTGQAGGTYTLTDSSDVEVSSQTSFSATLSSTDKSGVDALLNQDGTTALSGTTYNLAAADNWMRAAAATTDISDLSGNGITVSNAADTIAPTISAANITISGASGIGGAFRVGDTVTANWDNTAGGDNNNDVASVTVDFSQFGGGAAVSASNSSGTWTATFTITEDGGGSIDATNRNISVTAIDTASNSNTVADTSNATVDNDSPVVTDANLSIIGASGTGGAFIVGDTVTATWDNTAIGDNNSDTISGVTVDFSAFGGGSAVAASNSSGSWTATYTITAGAIDASNLNVAVTATDNAGNATTTADSGNATVDNNVPTVTDANLALSGASGTAGAFIVGDTVTASWNNSAGGDNNADIVSVTVDFSQFGGGAAVPASNSSGTWSASFAITEDGGGGIEASNLNVALTATDDAGNNATGADSSNATVDNNSPEVSELTPVVTPGSDNTPDVTISTTQAGTLDVGGSCGSAAEGAITAGSNAITLTQPDNSSALADASYSDCTVNMTDANGNPSNVLTLTSFTIDTTAPDAPGLPDLAAASDSGTSDTDDITNVTTPTLNGTAEADSDVEISSSADGVLATVSADGAGNWTYTPGTALSEAVHSITATATDAAGNTSAASAPLSLTIDVTTPNPATVPDLDAASDTGSSDTDNITSDTTPTFNGNTEANAAVSLESDQDGTIGSGTADSSGNWSITSNALSLNTHLISAVVSDVAGNEVTTGTLSVQIDTDAPSLSIGAPNPDASNTGPISFTLTFANVDTVDLQAGDITPVFTGTAAGTVNIINGTSMTPEVQLTGLTGDGTVTITVAAGASEDSAGNPTPETGPSNAATIDNTAPAISFGTPTPLSSASGPVTFPITIADGDTINLTVADVSLVTTDGITGDIAVNNGTTANPSVVVSNINGTGSFGIQLAADFASDAVGNNSEAASSPTATISNELPIFTASGPFDIIETAANGTVVGDVDANDGNGGAADAGISYSITAGNAAGAFAIDSSTGEVSVADNSVLDFNTTPSYLLTIEASDGGGASQASVTINLIEDNGSDADGIRDDVENQAPNNGDGNNDGIPDAQQDFVASFPSSNGVSYVTIEALDCSSVFIDETSTPLDDTGFEYPFGSVSFTLPCETAEVAITIAEPGQANLRDSSFRVSRASLPTKMSMNYLELPNTVRSDNTWLLTLVGGTEYDLNGVAAGISASGGPAVAAASHATPIPTIGWAGRLGLALLLGLMGMGALLMNSRRQG